MFNQAVARSVVVAMSLFAAACTPGSHAEPLPVANHKPTPLAPEFAGIEHWLNSEPLAMSQLRGNVVLVEFWTYSCINCIRVMPHVKQWHESYRHQGLIVVGVHTPEYDEEKALANVQNAVQRFDIDYPVALDNGFETWNAYDNRFWPALYLVDREGRVAYHHFGEGDYAETEARIQQLLLSR